MATFIAGSTCRKRDTSLFTDVSGPALAVAPQSSVTKPVGIVHKAPGDRESKAVKSSRGMKGSSSGSLSKTEIKTALIKELHEIPKGAIHHATCIDGGFSR